ncbi:MAG: RES family NAD+ phosphorylase [Actinomycetota bacterium]|nr:RES family NAD+ phosphorylase [Actinomycetota bacterium]
MPKAGAPVAETLDARHLWLRLADPAWSDPLDQSFAPTVGGRWTPVYGPPTLYFNADVATARANVRRLCAGFSIEPEDLDDDNGYALVTARLPPRQRVADAHTTAGLAALGLPSTYPLDATGQEIDHRVCQRLGQRIFDTGLRGVHCRSVATPDGSGRELGWFPGPGAHARPQATDRFADWYY